MKTKFQKLTVNHNTQFYKIIENLGFVHSIGKYAKIIEFEGKEKVIVRQGKIWFFHEPQILSMSNYIGQ